MNYYYYTRTTWVSRYQKGKTSLDLREARDGGVLGYSGISWTISTISMFTRLMCKALILRGGHGYIGPARSGHRRRQYSTFAPSRTHAPRN